VAALSAAALAALCRTFLPADPVTGYAIARAESGGRPEAIGDGGLSFGIWQIYTPAHPQWSGAWLLDATHNAMAAQALSGGGRSWLPWCTWEAPACGGRGNARYRAYLPEARAALSLPPPPPGPPPAPSPSPASPGLPWAALLAGLALVYYSRGGGRPGAS